MEGDMRGGGIQLHSPEDFAGMRAAGQLAARTLDMITPHVREGVTTGELDRLIHDFMVANGAVPATLGYRAIRLRAAFRSTMSSAMAYRETVR